MTAQLAKCAIDPLRYSIWFVVRNVPIRRAIDAKRLHRERLVRVLLKAGGRARLRALQRRGQRIKPLGRSPSGRSSITFRRLFAFYRRVHFMRNALAHARKTQQRMVIAPIATSCKDAANDADAMGQDR